MHKKHFVESEQIALSILSKLNVLTEMKKYHVFGRENKVRFDCFHEMIATTLKTTKAGTKWRNIVFIRVGGVYQFVVKVVLGWSLATLGPWEIMKIVVGSPFIEGKTWIITEVDEIPGMWDINELELTLKRRIKHKKGIKIFRKDFIYRI